MTVVSHTHRTLDVKNRFIEKILGECPKHGQGVHLWLFRAARHLHAHYGQMQIVELLADAVQVCGRPVPLREIQAAVRDSAAVAWMPNRETGTYSTPVPKPAARADIAVKAVTNGMTVADLWEASPMRFEGEPPATILPMLFDDSDLLCLGKSAKDFKTQSLADWLQEGDLTAYPLIVPSPMKSQWGTTQEGKPSMRCLSNCGPRRWLVVEFDECTPDSQAARLWFLSQCYRLKMCLWSGNESLHGWFSADGVDVDTFYAIAISIGCDPATKSPCQLVRMPNAIRDNGNLQGIIYFKP